MRTEGHQAGGERGGLALRVPAWRWGVSHIAVVGPDSTHLLPITGFAFLRAISLPLSLGPGTRLEVKWPLSTPRRGWYQPNLPKPFSLVRNQIV